MMQNTMISNTMTFSQGEKLSAHKLNELVGMIRQQNSPTLATPNGLGFKGDTRWQTNEIVLEQPANTGRKKPFDIHPQWDNNGNLTAYVITKPYWYEHGESHELSANYTIAHGNMGNIRNISLCEMSSTHDLSAENERWRLLDNMQMSSYDNNQNLKIKNKWRIYDLENGLVTMDYRDAFVQIAMSGGGTGEITLSGTDTSYHQDDEFRFQSAPNANVRVVINGNKIQLGVYYV